MKINSGKAIILLNNLQTLDYFSTQAYKQITDEEQSLNFLELLKLFNELAKMDNEILGYSRYEKELKYISPEDKNTISIYITKIKNMLKETHTAYDVQIEAKENEALSLQFSLNSDSIDISLNERALGYIYYVIKNPKDEVNINDQVYQRACELIKQIFRLTEIPNDQLIEFVKVYYQSIKALEERYKANQKTPETKEKIVDIIRKRVRK